MLLSLLALSDPAHAFCGTYVGPLGEELTNAQDQVILARDGERTTLTLAPDATGTTRSFGMILPIPEILTVEDVRLVDAALFSVFGAWSAPRLVSYTCDDFYGRDESDADADSDSDSDTDSAGVTVEASFSIGAYDLSVLSADGAGSLSPWLEARGFVVPPAADPILQAYIDGGQFFLAAQVDLDDLPAGGALPPIQLSYDDPGFVLPIRLGTTVSAGLQDLYVYAIADGTTVAVANYPEAAVESDCMVPPDTSPADHHAAALDAAFAQGIWLQEYAWSTDGCDPCASDPPTADDLAEAGSTAANPTLTRLHLRYTPDQITQDLALYPTNQLSYQQIKYIQYNHDLESTLPTCGIGTPDDPGTCPGQDSGTPDSGYPDSADTGPGADPDAPGKEGGCGCASPGAPALLPLLVLLPLRRRRSAACAGTGSEDPA